MAHWQRLSLSFFTGAAALCFFSLFQKMAIGAPLIPKGFLVPFLAGGGFGLLLGVRNYRLRAVMEELSRARRRLEGEVEEQSLALDRDMAARRRIEESLRRSEAQYRTLVETIPHGIQEVDLEGRIVFANDAYHRLMGYVPAELIGTRVWDHSPSEEAKEKERAYFLSVVGEHPPPTRYVARNLRKDGAIIDLHIDWDYKRDAGGDPAGFISVVTDVTEQKRAEAERLRLEEQLRQAQKMEAIGTLAGGIAHDFNNLLFPIIGYAEMAAEDLPPESSGRSAIEEILKAALRAKELVKQILVFGRKSGVEMKPVSMQPIVKESLKLLRATIPASIRIDADIDRTRPVHADPTRIHQVIINLCTNAYHAMTADGGVLTVRLSETEVGPAEAAASPDARSGSYARLTIRDTGVGMNGDLIANIFDPYFTTKDREKGTGLGLAVVHGIIREHGGFITVESEKGAGSAFHVHIPVISMEAPAEAPPADEPLPVGTERVLVVDDEAVVVDMLEQILCRLGYRVTVRYSSLDALALFHKRPDDFDLVITDMAMPNMTGDRLGRRLREIRPEIPLIICTGYSDGIDAERASAQGFSGYLMKPVIRGELARTVRTALDYEEAGRRG